MTEENNSLDPKGSEGAKKVPLWLVPPVAKAACARVLSLGLKKYGPWNWRKGEICRSTYISAMHRHLDAWQGGEDLDPESGESHLAHIMASCALMLDADSVGNLVDDTQERGSEPEAAQEQEKGMPVEVKVAENLTSVPWEMKITKKLTPLTYYYWEFDADDRSWHGWSGTLEPLNKLLPK